jgi:hypothetical protein
MQGLPPTSSIGIFGLISCAESANRQAAEGQGDDAEKPVISKQKIGWSLVALAFALVLIRVRYATLYWFEVLAVPIAGLVALGLAWGLSE